MSEKDKQNEGINEAAALKYDPDKDGAPQIVALGRGYVAERMIEAARESGVQVIKDKGVSSVLMRMNVGDEIPEQLYKAVAQILVFISSMDEDYKAKFKTR